MKNPASQVFRDHSTAFLEFAKQLGLSFAAPARTTATKEEDGDGGRHGLGRGFSVRGEGVAVPGGGG